MVEVVEPATQPNITANNGARSRSRGKFLVQLIKPSHYDDDGYVIQWWRGWIPSNSLSCIYGLALDAKARRVLGDDVNIEIEACDETNSVVPLSRIIRRFRRNGWLAWSAWSGFRATNFPAPWTSRGYCAATGSQS